MKEQGALFDLIIREKKKPHILRRTLIKEGSSGFFIEAKKLSEDRRHWVTLPSMNYSNS